MTTLARRRWKRRRRRLQTGWVQLVSPEAIDRMLGDVGAAGMAIDGPDGLLGQITRAVLERALGAELDDPLGYVRGDRPGPGRGTPAMARTARR